MTPVKSSNISAVAHDPKTGVLSVRFKSGDTFRYRNITAKQHTALMAAKSKGGWLAENVVRKPIAHPYVKESPVKTKPDPKPTPAKPRRHVLGMGKLMGNYEQPPMS